jgi:hypothetical protein
MPRRSKRGVQLVDGCRSLMIAGHDADSESNASGGEGGEEETGAKEE